MHRIDTFVFWMGGVVTQHLSQTIVEVLERRGRPTDIRTRRALVDLEADLCRGAMGAEDYCKRVVEVGGAPFDAETLATAIPEHLSAMPGMPALLGELAEAYRLRLVAGFPRQWATPVVERAGVARCFSEPVLFSAEYGPADCGPALLEKLLASGEIVRDSTLWVDDHPHRAMSAIRLGIDAAIFVDEPRLRRDLGLWSLLPLP